MGGNGKLVGRAFGDHFVSFVIRKKECGLKSQLLERMSQEVNKFEIWRILVFLNKKKKKLNFRFVCVRACVQA